MIVTVAATVVCPHSAPVSISSSNTRVLLGGQAVATLADNYAVAGCTFAVGPKPQPCVRVQWLTPATHVLVGGNPVILQSSNGLCLSAEQIPQGPPNVAATQARVQAT